MRRKSTKYLIGIDEAGRGPLAGPVAVVGIKINVKRKTQSVKFLKNIRDSKKLSARQREEWFRILTNHPKIDWAVAKIWPKVIDRINIARAANLGAWRVYKKLNNVTSRQSLKNNYFTVRAGLSRAQSREGHTLLDGGLKLPPYIMHQAIVKGDEKIPVIAAASIIAKVTRDRTMLRLHKKYPQYGFDAHKGYGTKLHQAAIKKFGRCGVHRKTFKVLDISTVI